MKHLLISILLISLVSGACSLPLGVPPTATATEIVLSSDTPTPENTAISTETATISVTPSDTPTPSETPLPSDTPTETPTATGTPFDPADQYGTPTLLDSLNNDNNWVDSSGKLPDNDFIQMGLGGGMLHVTGKQAGFDTWWFTAPIATDLFLQTTTETNTCTGKQAYGLILRGPQQVTSNSARGYIFLFSCDGSYRLDRLDSTSPYTKVELIDWTESDHINNGSDKRNVMGIRIIGDTITLYANGFELDEFEESHFSNGKFGLFVNAGPQANFTVDVDEFVYWDLD